MDTTHIISLGIVRIVNCDDDDDDDDDDGDDDDDAMWVFPHLPCPRSIRPNESPPPANTHPGKWESGKRMMMVTKIWRW